MHAAQFASSALQRKRALLSEALRDGGQESGVQLSLPHRGERIKPALLKQRFAEATNTVPRMQSRAGGVVWPLFELIASSAGGSRTRDSH